MTDPDLTMLALGTDLTSLGLNLNAPEPLHRSVVSPLSDSPVRREPEFEVPACYKHTPPRLQPGHLAKFKEETLFYIFYSMPQDEAQLIAADELYSRGWWWHKKYRCWFIHAPNSPVTKGPAGNSERGTYLFFDAGLWDVVQKADVEVFFDDVEVPSRLPRQKVPAAK
jgi:CCR4-NOT transcription complex subunit 2